MYVYNEKYDCDSYYHNYHHQCHRNKNGGIFLTLDHEKKNRLCILTEIFHSFEETLTTIVLLLRLYRQAKLELNNYL